jgi:hypothetical protein
MSQIVRLTVDEVMLVSRRWNLLDSNLPWLQCLEYSALLTRKSPVLYPWLLYSAASLVLMVSLAVHPTADTRTSHT